MKSEFINRFRQKEYYLFIYLLLLPLLLLLLFLLMFTCHFDMLKPKMKLHCKCIVLITPGNSFRIGQRMFIFYLCLSSLKKIYISIIFKHYIDINLHFLTVVISLNFSKDAQTIYYIHLRYRTTLRYSRKLNMLLRYNIVFSLFKIVFLVNVQLHNIWISYLLGSIFQRYISYRT